MQFSSNFKGTNPYFEQILGSRLPPGVKTLLAPLTKILDPPLSNFVSTVDLLFDCVLTYFSHKTPVHIGFSHPFFFFFLPQPLYILCNETCKKNGVKNRPPGHLPVQYTCTLGVVERSPSWTLAHWQQEHEFWACTFCFVSLFFFQFCFPLLETQYRHMGGFKKWAVRESVPKEEPPRKKKKTDQKKKKMKTEKVQISCARISIYFSSGGGGMLSSIVCQVKDASHSDENSEYFTHSVTRIYNKKSNFRFQNVHVQVVFGRSFSQAEDSLFPFVFLRLLFVFDLQSHHLFSVLAGHWHRCVCLPFVVFCGGCSSDVGSHSGFTLGVCLVTFSSF